MARKEKQRKTYASSEDAIKAVRTVILNNRALKIYNALYVMKGDHCVSDMWRAVGKEQSDTSMLLNKMWEVGILDRRRCKVHKRVVLYRIASKQPECLRIANQYFKKTMGY